jgi:hypothetical protein
VSDERKMLNKQFQQIKDEENLVNIEVATILKETLKQIKNGKSEPEKTYEQGIVNLMREMDNTVKLYAELSTSDLSSEEQ